MITDHKPLLSILGPKHGVPPLAAARMQRWALSLSAYSHDIGFWPTDRHGNADGLSRLPLSDVVPIGNPCDSTVFNLKQLESLPVTAQAVSSAMRTDPVLSQLLRYLRNGWPDTVPEELTPFWRRKEDLRVEGNCILW